ncbi:MAG: hypothetical protein JW863_00295 [Chitinispirillaceae bacterium]|nr:hypothetical protein [Chitinispirillaceae bacterium]
MKKAVVIVLFLAAIFLSCNGEKSNPEQEDFDRIRLNHLNYLFETVREYAAVKGAVPFAAESDTVPVVVIFETEEQAERHNGKYPIIVHLETRFPEADSVEKPQRVAIKKADELYRELKTALNTGVISVTDPQALPGKKPCLYIMTIYKNVFDVTTFLHNPLPFTRKLAQGNNKVSLTSAKKSYPLVAIWTQRELCGKTVYKVFMNEPFNDTE